MALCDAILPHGTYILVNAQGGTALDFYPTRPRIEGYGLHCALNQRWRFANTGRGWAIQSCRALQDGRPAYLSVRGALRDGCEVVHSPEPLSWYVWNVEGALRIGWPGTDYVVALGGGGNSANATPVQMMRLKPGLACQLWYFTRCGEDLGARPTMGPGVEAPPQALPKPGPSESIHVLAHVHEAVALELDSASRKWVRHRPSHKDHSQQWKFITNGEEDVIQAARRSLEDELLYLNVQGHAEPGARVVASPYPVGWCIERCMPEDGKHAIRIFWPKTNLVVSAGNNGENDTVLLAECDNSPLSKWDDVTVYYP